MPNGRSGGFIIEKTELKNLVGAFPSATVVATKVEFTRLRPLDALEAGRLIDECRNDRIAVEEQDHTGYIVHLSNEPEIIWFGVVPDSPIFLELRQRHQRWVTEHPNWDGWIAF